MTNIKIFKCQYCKSIICLPAASWERYIFCKNCGKSMEKLDDEFDLSEIISEDIKEEKSVEQSK